MAVDSGASSEVPILARFAIANEIFYESTMVAPGSLPMTLVRAYSLEEFVDINQALVCLIAPLLSRALNRKHVGIGRVLAAPRQIRSDADSSKIGRE